VDAVPPVDLATTDIERHARRASERAVREGSPWIEALGRFGHAAIGLVYATIGVLAAQAALGRGGGTTDSQGALAWLVQRPHGHALLVALAVGLAGYAAWRVVEAILDTESKGSDPKGIAARLVYAGIGATYAALALSALRLGLQWADGDGGGGDASARDWTAWLLSQPFGQILVVAAGLVIVGVALFQFYVAYTEKFCDPLRMGELSGSQQRLVRLTGRVGYAARGVAFAIIGMLLAMAGLHARPAEARGLGGALDTLAEQPFGPWLLGAVAVGLVAYGAFMLVQSLYRRIVIR
jgi:hypothetical protein